jgi:hypothetical protein
MTVTAGQKRQNKLIVLWGLAIIVVALGGSLLYDRLHVAVAAPAAASGSK